MREVLVGASAVIVAVPIFVLFLIVSALHVVAVMAHVVFHKFADHVTTPVLDGVIRFARWTRQKAGLPPHPWLG